MSIRIAVSMRGPMRALASQGILATDCHAQLKAILLQKLGPEHAALLAEPQHDAEGSSVDWYAEGQGPAIALKDLPEEDANTLRARATSLANDIAALSGTLTSDAQARQALSGQLLRLALQHPSDGDIWSVNGQPVLVNWGFAPGSAGALPQDLTRLGAALPPPPVPPVPAPAAGAGCLPWLLPLLLLLLLLWLLGAALGLFPSPLPAGCLPVDRKNLVAEEQRAAALDDELALLWSQLLERAALCKPVKPAPVQEEKEEPVAPLPEPEIVEPFLGETPPAPKPVPQPKPEKPKEQPKPVEPPRQPEKPKKKKRGPDHPAGCRQKERSEFS